MPIIFVPENQTGFYHTRMEEYTRTIPLTYCIYEHGGPKAGIAKTQTLTADYVRRTVDYLSGNHFRFDAEWISSNGHKHRNGRAGLLEELKLQLIRYGYDERRKLGGKYDGAFQDDLCIAFMMHTYWTLVIDGADRTSPYAHLNFPLPEVSAFGNGARDNTLYF